MKRVTLLALALLCAASFVFAQDFTIAYVEGYVDVEDGGSWYELYIGDPVGAADRIRLGQGSYAELSDGSTTIKLTRPGIYTLSELTASARRTENPRVGGLVLGRIGRLTGSETTEQQSVAGGVRASEAVNQNQPTWAGGESVDELIDEGLGLLNTGEFQDAYYVFQEAYDYALDDDEYAKSLFYYGYGAALIGQTSEAFDLLEEIGPDPDTDYFADHAIVLGQLLIESFAYEDAIAYLEMVTNEGGVDDGARQSALLLAGLAYNGMGNTRLARTYLERSRDVDPASEGAEVARELLAQL